MLFFIEDNKKNINCWENNTGSSLFTVHSDNVKSLADSHHVTCQYHYFNDLWFGTNLTLQKIAIWLSKICQKLDIFFQKNCHLFLAIFWQSNGNFPEGQVHTYFSLGKPEKVHSSLTELVLSLLVSPLVIRIFNLFCHSNNFLKVDCKKLSNFPFL